MTSNLRLRRIICRGDECKFYCYSRLEFDVFSWLDTEKPLKQRKEGFSLDQYNQIDDVYQFLDEMAESYPNTASVFTVGESYEGRLIKGMKISTNEKNPAIFIEANIHAREWISSATAVWIINHVLTETDPEFKALIDSVNWYIVPFTNPDGILCNFEPNFFIHQEIKLILTQVTNIRMMKTGCGEKLDQSTISFVEALTLIATLDTTLEVSLT